MKYKTHVWLPDSDLLNESEFISTAAHDYLSSCENEVFNAWESNFPTDKSLAGVMSKTVLTKLETDRFAVDACLSINYGVSRAFHHRSSTSDMFVDIFSKFNHERVNDFLIITQSERFKQKFLYDSATMSFETVTRDFGRFVNALVLNVRPRLFILTLNDFSFETDIFQMGKKKFLKLTR